MTDLTKLEADLSASIAAAPDVAALEAVRVGALGKSGSISDLLKTLGSLSPDERREQGPAINGLRDRVGGAIAARKAELEAAELDAKLAAERVDLTLPPPPSRRGRVHPTMQVMDEMIAIFAEMGFGLAEGPDIEDDFHNFTALNFPPKHPAREMHDTFWLPEDERGERKVLRTHTSPVQIRTLQQGQNDKLPSWIATSQEPPIRIVVPGRTYRSDSDATHTPMFHQMEGLVIDRAIHMGHLKWTLEDGFIATVLRDVPLVETRFRSAPLPVHRAQRRDGRALRPLRRRREDRPGRRLDGDRRLRDGASQCAAQLRGSIPTSGRGFGLRLRHRPAGDAEGVRWHARPARHVRVRMCAGWSTTAGFSAFARAQILPPA